MWHPPQGLGEQGKVTLLRTANPPRALPVHDVIHIHWSTLLSAIFTLTSVNDTSSPHARQHLCSSLHPTNPCTKRKVLGLTKPKGRIYKTKSHGYYITFIPLFEKSLNFKLVSTYILLRKEVNAYLDISIAGMYSLRKCSGPCTNDI